MMYKQQSMSLDNALEDAALSTIAVNYSDDVKEGIAAFHAKRKPEACRREIVSSRGARTFACRVHTRVNAFIATPRD